MKKFVVIGVFILASVFLYSQPWLKYIPKTKKNNPSFFDEQKAFYKYWSKYEVKNGFYVDETGTKKKAYGYKQFKRYEWFMEPRVDKNGYLPVKTYISELEKVKKQKSTNGNWQSLGPATTPLEIGSSDIRGVGRLNGIAFDPDNEDIIYVAAPDGGVWKTTNGGQSWTVLTDDFASLGVSDIAISPQNGNIIYLATGDRDANSAYSTGVYKSTDCGNNWSLTSLTFSLADNIKLSRILVDPNNSNKVITGGNDGIYVTTDGGNTWTQTNTDYIKDMEYAPDNANIIYATTYSPYDGEAKILKSTDGGNTWSDISPNVSGVARIDLGITSDNPDVIYALMSNSDDYGFHSLYKSTNKGNSWTELQNSNYSLNYLDWYDGTGSGGQGWYDLTIAVDPADENHLFIGGINIWESTDGGMSFSQSSLWYHGGGSQYVHADQHHLVFNPLNGTLYSANDGGIYKYENNTWTNISDGIVISQIYRIGTSQTTNDKVAMGLQDNGTLLRDNGTYSAILGGDGMEAIINPDNNNVIYGEYYYGNLYKSTDGGYNFTEIAPASDGAWVTPYVLDPNNSNTIYAGYTDLYKSTNAGTNWTNLTNGITSGNQINDIAVSSADNSYIYFSCGNDFYVSTDGGSNWNLIHSFPNSITDIAVAYNNPQKVYVSLSGFNDYGHVFLSTDAGNNWTDITGGLPNVPTNTIVYQENTNDILYVGTDLGVFVKNGTEDWQLFNNGMPFVVIDELEINYATNKIYAATFGRGLWYSDLYSDTSGALNAEFSFYVSDNCAGEVNFYNNSSGDYTNTNWNFGDGNTSTDQNPVHYYTSAGTYDVTLTITDDNGNTSEVTHQVTITQTQVTANFTATNNVGCSAPLTVTFNNTSANANIFYWDFGDGSTSTDENPEHTYNQPGIYDVKLISSSNICGTDSVVKNSFVEITDTSVITAIFPTSGTDVYSCCRGMLFDNGYNGQYSNNITSYVVINVPGSNYINLHFYFIDLELNYDSLFVYQGGGYNLTLIGAYTGNTLPNGTGDMQIPGETVTIKFKSDQYVTGDGFKMSWTCDNLSQVETHNEGTHLTVFPNPAHKEFDVYYQNLPYDVKITTLDGKTVRKYTNIKSNKFKVSDLEKGVYLINITSEFEVVQTKIVIL